MSHHLRTWSQIKAGIFQPLLVPQPPNLTQAVGAKLETWAGAFCQSLSDVPGRTPPAHPEVRGQPLVVSVAGCLQSRPFRCPNDSQIGHIHTTSRERSSKHYILNLFLGISTTKKNEIFQA